MSDLEVIGWRGGKVWFLDQTLLPEEERMVETEDPAEIARAIKRLAVRGAPLIGVAAAYGFALGFRSGEGGSLRSRAERLAQLFGSTRPTAANLFKAIERMKRRAVAHIGSAEDLPALLLQEAVAIHNEERIMCREMAQQGADLLKPGSVVLTHCNAGALATGGIGTALGVLRVAWERGTLRHVYMDETRPLLQGARLTAWELGKAGIPSTLITDAAAAFLMQQGAIHAVLVGADRIAANGDIANKIGTYALAVAARYHGIPFYVAAPTTTLDPETATGKEIPIEVRSEDEVVLQGGRRMAPLGTEVYSPAFDITPAGLISALITERGVMVPPFEEAIASMGRERVA